MVDEPRVPARLLRLLSLLESRRVWSGRELSRRLGVTARTLRRDMERLRALDYPVVGTTGTSGGYRLDSGRNLPPLQLADDEAIAVAVALAAAGWEGNTGIAGIEESSMRALAKLERVLPKRLRPRLAALAESTVAAGSVGGADGGKHANLPVVDPVRLASLASYCRDHEIVSFDYRGNTGEVTARRVEPHHLVTVSGRWYLLAYDPRRQVWRTFRVDRVQRPRSTYRGFTPRALPAPDPATYVRRAFRDASYVYTAGVAVRLPAHAVRDTLIAPILGRITEDGPDACTVHVTARTAGLVAQYVAAIAALGADITVDADPEIVKHLRAAGRNLAVGSARGQPAGSSRSEIELMQ